MKKTIVVIFSCLLIFLFSATSHAILLGLQPSTESVFAGDTFTMDLVISGLGDGAAPSVGAFDLDVTFDPFIFDFVDYSLGPDLGDISMGEAYDWSLGQIMPGTINLNEFSLLEADPASGPFFIPPYLDDIQPASFSLASLTFQALDLAGESRMQIQIDEMFGQGVYDGLGDILAVDALGDSTISVKTVPEPATILLVMSGMAGLGIFGRKRFRPY